MIIAKKKMDNSTTVLVVVIVIIILVLIFIFAVYHSYTEVSVYYSGFWNFGMLTTPASPSCSPSVNPQCVPSANMNFYYQFKDTILGVGQPDTAYNGSNYGSQTNLTVYTTTLTTSPAYLISPLKTQYNKNLTGAHWKIIPKDTRKPWDGGDLYNTDLECYAVPVIRVSYPVTNWGPDWSYPPKWVLIQCLSTYIIDNSTIYPFNWSWKPTDSYVNAPTLQCEIKVLINGVSTPIYYYMAMAGSSHGSFGTTANLSYIQNLYIKGDFWPIQPTYCGWFWNRNSVCNLYSEILLNTGGGTCTENSDCGLTGTCVGGKCLACTGGLLGPNCQWPTPASVPR